MTYPKGKIMLTSTAEKDAACRQLETICKDYGIKFEDIKGPFLDSLLAILQQFGPVLAQALLSWLIGMLPKPPVPTPIAKP